MSIKWMCLSAMLAITPAHAQRVGVFITYEAWETLDQNDRVVYLAGTLDGLLMFARGETASVFYACLQREKLTVAQLSTDIEELGRSSPEVKSRAVQEALFAVLQKKCG